MIYLINRRRFHSLHTLLYIDSFKSAIYCARFCYFKFCSLLLTPSSCRLGNWSRHVQGMVSKRYSPSTSSNILQKLVSIYCKGAFRTDSKRFMVELSTMVNWVLNVPLHCKSYKYFFFFSSLFFSRAFYLYRFIKENGHPVQGWFI